MAGDPPITSSTSHTFRLCPSLAEMPLCPTSQVIDEDVNSSGLSQALEVITVAFRGTCAADHIHMTPAAEPLFSPSHCPVI